MNTPQFRRLLLESTEERITPSRGAELPPSWVKQLAVVSVPQAEDRHGDFVRDVNGLDRLTLADRATPDQAFPRLAAGFPFLAMRLLEEFHSQQADELGTEEKIAPPPAALLREILPVLAATRLATVAAPHTLAVRPADVETSGTGTSITPNPATAISVGVHIPAPLADKPLTPAGAENLWPVVFVGTNVDAAEAKPVEDVTKSESLKPSTTPAEEPHAPAPSLVDRAIDAILPSGIPLHGVLPLAEEWLELGANGLLTHLDNLGQDETGDMPIWEQATWIAGAVLVLGGVTYTAGVNRSRRRLDRVVIGTDSALARWEDQNARPTTG